MLSHWLLDCLHVYLGLGLFNTRLGMPIVEGLLWLAGIVIYERATRSRKRAGAWALYIVIAILTLLWLPSLSGAAPNVSVATMGKIDIAALTILVAWAYWVDSLREPTVGAEPQLASPARQAG